MKEIIMQELNVVEIDEVSGGVGIGAAIAIGAGIGAGAGIAVGVAAYLAYKYIQKM